MAKKKKANKFSPGGEISQMEIPELNETPIIGPSWFNGFAPSTIDYNKLGEQFMQQQTDNLNGMRKDMKGLPITSLGNSSVSSNFAKTTSGITNAISAARQAQLSKNNEFNYLGANQATVKSGHPIVSEIGKGIHATTEIGSMIADAITQKKNPYRNFSDIVGYAYGGNLFDVGGGMGNAMSGMDKAGNAVQTATALAANAVQQAQTRKADEVISGLTASNNQRSFSATDDIDSWANTWNRMADYNKLHASDFRNKSIASDVLNGVSAMNQGVQAGSTFGPVGGIIGGIVGGVSSNLGSAIGRINANKQKIKANKYIAYTNDYNDRSGRNALDNILSTQLDTALLNYGSTGMNHAAFGGDLGTNGTDFGSGLIEINAGGSHEMNPREGVQMGADGEGTPNLVEQGEVIDTNNNSKFAYTNRLEVPEETLKELGIKKKKGQKITYADAVKISGREFEERPNDPISKKGMEASLLRLKISQEKLKEELQAQEALKQQLAMQGAGIDPNALAQQQMPQQAIPQGMPQATPEGFAFGGNLYALAGSMDDSNKQKGGTNTPVDFSTYNPAYDPETGKYDFETNRDVYNFIVRGADREDKDAWDNWNRIFNAYKTLPGYTQPGMAYALADAQKHWWNTYNMADASSIPTSNMSSVEVTAKRPEPTPPPPPPAPEEEPPVAVSPAPAPKPTPPPTPIAEPESVDPVWKPTWYRDFGIASEAGLLLHNLASKPEMKYANRIQDAANAAAVDSRIGFDKLGDYLTPRVYDVNQDVYNLMSTAGGTRRASANNLGGNRAVLGAHILASDDALMKQIGEARLNAWKANGEEDRNRATFKRETNKINSEGTLQAAKENQNERRNALKDYNAGTQIAQKSAQDVYDKRQEAINSSLEALGNNVAAKGKENAEFNRYKSLMMTGYYGVPPVKPEGFTNAEYRAMKQNAKKVQEEREAIITKSADEVKAEKEKNEKLATDLKRVNDDNTLLTKRIEELERTIAELQSNQQSSNK